jgi:hypothetical protein
MALFPQPTDELVLEEISRMVGGESDAHGD